jgi:hypothetical protein
VPVLPVMQARPDLDPCVREAVVYRVRKLACDDASQITVGNRSHLRHCDQQLEHTPQIVLELATETRAFAIVPTRHALNVARCSRRQCDRARTRRQRRRAFSSSTEIVACSAGSARR